MTQQTHVFPMFCRTRTPFAFRTVCRLRHDYKQRRRRGLEGIGHSTSFTPIESSGPPPAHSRWRARIPFPVRAGRAECWRRSFGAVVDSNQLRPALEARCWLARAIGASLLPSPRPTSESRSSFFLSSFFLLLTNSLL